jgi:glycosyltransferase 2 family protein
MGSAASVSDHLPEANPPSPGDNPTIGRGWRSMVFAPIGEGQRRRRGSDGTRLAAAALALFTCLVVIRYNSRIDRAIVQVIHPAPRSITWMVTVVYDLGAFGITIALVALALLARRWVVARDIGLSVLASAVVSGVLIVLLGGNGNRPSGVVIDGYHLRFPVLQIAAFMAIATAALPYLSRGLQRLIEVFVVLVALASAVGGHGLPVNVLGSLAVGWGTTALIHLIFGSPLGLPSRADVAWLLGQLGVPAEAVQPLQRQVWGVAKYRAVAVGGGTSEPQSQLWVSVYGRDASDAKILTKAGRFLFYRDSGPSLTITRLQQVEHEAYLTVRAGHAGAAVPEVLEAATVGPSKDALLVCRLPGGTALSEATADDVTDARLDDLYQQLRVLREAHLAHGAISGDTVVLADSTDTVMLRDFRNATSNAGPRQFDRDVASALAATALVVGADRAAAAAGRCLNTEQLRGGLQHLRRAGLDSALAHDLRGGKALLEDVRQRAAAARSIEVPKLVEPRRVSWPTLIMTVGTLIGGWALIGVLIDVSQSFDTVIGANWLWVVAAFVLTQLAVAASAVEAMGSVAGVLPFGRVLGVEVANSFSALAGGTAAVFATRVRFFQQQGSDSTIALSSGAIMATSSWIATAVLFLVSLPFAWGSIHLEATPESGGDSKLVWVILAIVVGVGLVAGLLLLVPRLRRRASDTLRPRLHDVWVNLKVVAQSPRKLVLLIGGSVGNELCIALALSLSLRAFDDHLRLPTLIVVITLASVIGGISPSPGGMGVVEAGMILGLTAAGVSEADATAAVFIQRLFSSYLPPMWGWVTLVWMRKREYL